jgi:hypothetical protein
MIGLINRPRYIKSTQRDSVLYINLYKPQVPNLSLMAANTTLVLVGASTWAIGNHKCHMYTGNLIKKVSINNLFVLSEIGWRIYLFSIL